MLGGVLPSRGVSFFGGASFWRGCLLPRGASFWGGCLLPRGCLLPGGASFWGGVPPSPGGGLSQHALRQTLPLLTESQTPVKTLPWPNFVAAGNNGPNIGDGLNFVTCELFLRRDRLDVLFVFSCPISRALI